ncbi:hypothetical protein IVA98_05685 [Bradyrhizobium sp. 160]|uniref:hypothetical protein n=1 Tax=Bradyrhizobium sp. 160 TaxID=2782634 RepID=UPI001FF8D847|nr:hypothetical protein [Bradyrhizobium sp. 160]MCK1622744.1 hypothetical protein [Bradyrhizobium sp. 160]
MTDPKKDPLEGFHFTDYDPATQEVTIKLHPRVLSNPKSREALEKHAQAIIEAGGIDKVTFEQRDGK